MRAHKTPVDTPAYQVLARKYRPQTFEDLIGQEAMVRTLTNAFAAGRIAHAFMLTGVRGVGKTTTARLLARALNYRNDTVDAPQIALDPPGEECAAITAARHPDVMEMDAASRTGVGDIREILDGVRYAPTRARFKVYVVDEVHMLSTSAFNALLKTLEEPPAHAKFIFATTEIRKVPVTVLSRCQRFDLRRVAPEALVAHLQAIAAKEKLAVEDDGLMLIARAAEGSVRDALSLLDQALVQGDGARKAPVTAAQVRDMLGLADRGRTLSLLEAVMAGDGAAAAQELEAQYADGADPAVVLRDVLDHCHALTRAKALGDAARFTDAADYVARVRAAADAADMGALTRLWQLLLKAHEDVRNAPDPLAAAEMALLRAAYAAGLPPPEAALRVLAGREAGAAVQGNASAATAGSNTTAEAHDTEDDPPAAPTHHGRRGGHGAAAAMEATPDAVAVNAQPAPAGPIIESLADIAALAEAQRDLILKAEIERTARPVRVEPGQVVFAPTPDAKPDLSARLSKALSDWTGARWLVSADAQARGGETLAEIREREHQALLAAVRRDPLVAKAFELWPEAEILTVRPGAESHDGGE